MCILTHFGMETKSENIDLLLSNLKDLETNISRIKTTDSFSFHFFRQSFRQTQEIMRLLHELEFLHVEEMKKQMEKLVVLLSENEKSINLPDNESADEIPEQAPETAYVQPAGNIHAQGISLPEYVNPRAKESSEEDIQTEDLPQDELPEIWSVNDIKNPPTSNLLSKKSLSLNDRFLFQRELFHNDRNEMNVMMLKLNVFENFQDAEQYLREHTSWNFEDKIVEDFLLVIKNGFE